MSGKVERFFPDVKLMPWGYKGVMARQPDSPVFGSDETKLYVRHSDYAALEARNAELTEQVEEEEAIRERVCKLLAETIVVLRGPAPELTLWSYHDIADWAREVVSEHGALEARCREMERLRVVDEKWRRAWCNRFITERTEKYRNDGDGYEIARVKAEIDADNFANAFAETFDAAIEQEGRQG